MGIAANSICNVISKVTFKYDAMTHELQCRIELERKTMEVKNIYRLNCIYIIYIYIYFTYYDMRSSCCRSVEIS
jgi:hypothetical protein